MENQSHTIAVPTNQWIHIDDLERFDIENLPLDWLNEKGSMTQKLMKQANGQLVIDLLKFSISVPFTNEASSLNLTGDEGFFVREVMMRVSGEDWMYGRSLIPEKTLRGNGQELANLGTEPLGSLLFDKDTSERVSIEVAIITPQHPLYPDNLTDNQNLWARRSVFNYYQSPLLVQEIFLEKSPLGLPSNNS